MSWRQRLSYARYGALTGWMRLKFDALDSWLSDLSSCRVFEVVVRSKDLSSGRELFCRVNSQSGDAAGLCTRGVWTEGGLDSTEAGLLASRSVSKSMLMSVESPEQNNLFGGKLSSSIWWSRGVEERTHIESSSSSWLLGKCSKMSLNRD